MKNLIVLMTFAGLSCNLWGYDGEKVKTDVTTEKTAMVVDIPTPEIQVDTQVYTTIISTDSVLPNGDVHTTDSILVEKVIEKIEPMVVMYEKKEWGKLIVAIFATAFLVLSILWKRRKDKLKKTDE